EAQHAAPPQGSSSSQREFSSSEYSKTIAGIVCGEPPAIELAAEKRLIDCLVALANEGAVQSAHDISDGGVAVTLAESCFAATQPSNCHSERSPRSEESLFSYFGAVINLPADASSPAEHAIFNERGARAIVSVSSTNLAAVQAIARQYNVTAREIGKVTSDNALRMQYKGRAVIDYSIDYLRDIWANSLERTMGCR